MPKRRLYELTKSITDLCAENTTLCKPNDFSDICYLTNHPQYTIDDSVTLEVGYLSTSNKDDQHLFGGDFHGDYNHMLYTHDRRLLPKSTNRNVYECDIKTPINSPLSELNEVFVGLYDKVLSKTVSYLKTLRVHKPINSTSDLYSTFSDWSSCDDVNNGRLFLVGGKACSGKTFVANSYVDYAISNKLYRSDNIIIIEESVDFDVLLDKISFGRIQPDSLVVIDELHTSGDIFSVNSLLEAGCDVLLVAKSDSFCDMNDSLLLNISSTNAINTAKNISKYLRFKLVCSTQQLPETTLYRYSSYATPTTSIQS